MAINPIPSVIDIASQDHCDILTAYFAGKTDVVYEPVETDTGTDQAPKIQKFLDLLKDGTDKFGVVVLQFPVGGIIDVNQTLQLGRCAGPELRGGGYKFSEEAYLSSTTTIRAMGPYTGLAGGFTDPFNPGNTKPPIFRSLYTVGLSMHGIAFDGRDSRTFTGDGFQMVAASGSSVNAAKHRYVMMAIRNCSRGWSHDQYSPGGNSNAGDTFFFSQCMFEGCTIGAYFDSPMDLQSIFDIVGFNYCGTAVVVFQAGQLRLRHVTAVATQTIIQASRMESNNRHLQLTGLKCDLNDKKWRPVVFKEVDLVSQPDGTSIPDTRVGGTRGNVTLADMMFAEGLGDSANGSIDSVADNGGKAQFTLSAGNSITMPAIQVGRFFSTKDATVVDYRLDVAVDTGQNWVIHEITSVVYESGSKTWTVDTNTTYAGNATGTWEDCTPMIIQTGGSAVTVKESFIPAGYRGDGKLAWMTTGNYGPGSLAAVLFVVRCEMGRPSDDEISYYIREMYAPNTGSWKPWNFWKITDGWSQWNNPKAPWSMANYPSEEGMDWTDTEREQIRHQLGVDGTQSAPTTNPYPQDSIASHALYAMAGVAGEMTEVSLTETYKDEAKADAFTMTYDTAGKRVSADYTKSG